MKLINQSVEFWGPCEHSEPEAVARIERAARTCYRSEPKGDPVAFLTRLIKPDPPHLSVFEHSNVVAYCYKPDYMKTLRLAIKLKSRWLTIESRDDFMYIFGNLRAWMETLGTRSWGEVYQTIGEEGLKIATLCEQPQHMKRVSCKLITDRAILAEITRHRDDTAFSVQSQRYVDYNGEVLYIKPSWYDTASGLERDYFYNACRQNEYDYKQLRGFGQAPQHARVVLNNQVATEIVITAYIPQWQWIFKLRRAGAAYPQMVQLMDQVYEKFQQNGLLK